MIKSPLWQASNRKRLAALDQGSQFLEIYQYESVWPKEFIKETVAAMEKKPHLKMPAPKVVPLGNHSTKPQKKNNGKKQFPEDYTMTDLHELQRRVAFDCQQCGRIITQVVCFGEFGGDLRMRVMCHNQTQMIDVPRSALDGHSQSAPYVVAAFQTKPKFDKKLPNVRFYCQACDELTAQFTYQHVPNREEHCFIILCSGRICASKSHARIFKEASLKDFKIFDHTTAPIILPIDGNLSVTRTAKAAQKAVSFAPPLPLRKLRYDVDS